MKMTKSLLILCGLLAMNGAGRVKVGATQQLLGVGNNAGVAKPSDMDTSGENGATSRDIVVTTSTSAESAELAKMEDDAKKIEAAPNPTTATAKTKRLADIQAKIDALKELMTRIADMTDETEKVALESRATELEATLNGLLSKIEAINITTGSTTKKATTGTTTKKATTGTTTKKATTGSTTKKATTGTTTKKATTGTTGKTKTKPATTTQA